MKIEKADINSTTIVNSLSPICHLFEKKHKAVVKELIAYYKKKLSHFELVSDDYVFTKTELGLVSASLKKIVRGYFLRNYKVTDSDRKKLKTLCDNTILPNEVIASKIVIFRKDVERKAKSRRTGTWHKIDDLETSVNNLLNLKILECFLKQNKEEVKKIASKKIFTR